MSGFMAKLAMVETERLLPPRNREQREADHRRNQLERKLEDTMGSSFLNEYIDAFYSSTAWEVTADFRAGLRFGLRLAMEAMAEE